MVLPYLNFLSCVSTKLKKEKKKSVKKSNRYKVFHKRATCYSVCSNLLFSVFLSENKQKILPKKELPKKNYLI